jgi:multidrug resistance efflux pump
VSLQIESDPGTRGASSPLSDKVRSLRITDQSPPRSSGATIPWVLAFLLAGSTGYLAYMQYGPDRERASEPLATNAASSSSETRSAAIPTNSNSSEVVLESKGYIVPSHQILVSPKVSGMVKYLRIQKPNLPPEDGVPLEEGMRVEKGDILAQLESTDYEADVARARAMLVSAQQKLEMERKNVPNEIERAKAELDEATTTRDYLKTVVDRNERLAKTVAVSPTEVEKAISDHLAAIHRVERLSRALELIKGPRAERIKVAEADVSQAGAELIKAEWRLGNCLILAPGSGTILKKTVEEGNIVNPVAFNGSYSVCEMADLSDLEVDLSIQERDVSRVFVGQRCIIRAEAYPERAYTGAVSRLMPIADRAKGAIPVRVKVQIPADEEGVYLKPEMGAVVSFFRADAPPAETLTVDVPDGQADPAAVDPALVDPALVDPALVDPAASDPTGATE